MAEVLIISTLIMIMISEEALSLLRCDCIWLNDLKLSISSLGIIDDHVAIVNVVVESKGSRIFFYFVIGLNELDIGS